MSIPTFKSIDKTHNDKSLYSDLDTDYIIYQATIRSQLGVTIEQLAAIHNISTATLNKWLKKRPIASDIAIQYEAEVIKI